MLSTRMIIDHRMLSMNSRRVAPRASLAAAAGAAIGMSVITALRYPPSVFLESRNIRKCQPAGMHMHAPEFGAAMQGRKHFSGVEQALRIEGAFQPLLLIEVDLAEHLGHQVALLDADAMFAGQDAAELDAAAQDVGAEGLSPLHLAGLVGIVEDQGLQIAVAGMKHVGDAELIFFRKLADARQGLLQRAARNGALHAEIVRRNPPDRRKRRLAAGPEQVALGLRIRNPAGGRPPPIRNRLHPPDQFVDPPPRTL